MDWSKIKRSIAKVKNHTDKASAYRGEDKIREAVTEMLKANVLLSEINRELTMLQSKMEMGVHIHANSKND